MNEAKSNQLVIDYKGNRDDPDEMMFIELKEDGTPLNPNSISYRVKRKDGFYSTTWKRDPRSRQCAICGHGWVNTCESLLDSLFLHEAPTGKECVHEKCYLGHLAMSQHRLFFSAICEGHIRDGIRILFDGLEEIENQYGGAWNTPWYKTNITGLWLGKSTDYARKEFKEKPVLVIGRRKRVDSLTLTSPFPLRIEKNEETKCLFEDSVTKSIDDKCVFKESELPTGGSSILIHAWDDDKVKQYIKAFCAILFDTVGGKDGQP